MTLSVALIVYELEKSGYTLRKACQNVLQDSDRVSGVRMLCGESFSDEFVYITDAGSVKNLKLPRHILAAGMHETPAGAVCVDLPGARLLNAVEDIFYRYDRIEAELNAAAARNEPLKTILSICARFFNNPVTVSDSKTRLIEVSDNAVRDRLPDYFRQTLDTGEIEGRIVEAMKNKGFDWLVFQSGAALLLELDDIPVRFFVRKIYEDNYLSAYLEVPEVFSPLHDAQTVIVDQITQIIKNYAFRDMRLQQASVTKVERITNELIDGGKYIDDIHALHLKKINWGVEDGYYLIKIQISPENYLMNTAQYTYSTAHSFFYDSLIVEREDSAVIVVCSLQIRYDFEKALANLKNYLKGRGDKAIISQKFCCFHAIYEQHRAISMAMQLAVLMDPEKSLYDFRMYLPHLLLKICSREIDLRVFCMYEAMLIYKYDNANGSELLKSLYVYLRYNRSLSAAADELKIHRNTLLYRLRRASEISGIDPSDNNVTQALIFSYEILRYRLKIE